MGSGSRPWTVLGIAVAVTYLAGIALWGSWATQGAAFTALAVGAVLGSVLRIGERILSRVDRSTGATHDSGAD